MNKNYSPSPFAGLVLIKNKDFRNCFCFSLILFVLSLILRILYVSVFTWHAQLSGDAFYFHWQAWMLVHGYGFSDPYFFLNEFSGKTIPKSFFIATSHSEIPSSRHPPAYVIFLALFDVFSLQSFGTQLILNCVIGALNIFVIMYFAALVFGLGTSYVAGFLAAFLPQLWIYDGQLLAEQLLQLEISILLIAIYKYCDKRTNIRVFFLGVIVAVCSLTRAEFLAAIVIPFIVIFFKNKKSLFNHKLKQFGICLLGCFLVVAPWEIRDLVSFRYPFLISADLGYAIEAANCPVSYYGASLGYENASCVSPSTIYEDQSVADHKDLLKGLHYALSHRSRAAQLVFIRELQDFYFWDPVKQVNNVNIFIDGYPALGIKSFWLCSYLVDTLTLAGFYFARKNKVILTPFIVITLICMFVVAITFSDIRFIAAAEVPWCILSAYAISQLFERTKSIFARKNN